MNENKPVKQKKEPVFWAGISIFCVVFVVFLAIAPTVFAQTRDAESNKLFSMFMQVFDFVQKNYVDEVDSKKLMDGALKGLFESLGDPFSAYLTETSMRDLTDTTTGEFGGVGLYISKRVLTDDAKKDSNYIPYVEVVAPIEGTPAYRQGISAGDYIMKIEGNSTADIDIDEVIKRLRGEPGTQVVVTILRGKNFTFDVTLTRAIIEVPTVRHAMIDKAIGYLRIIQFTPYTTQRVKESIDDFVKAGYSSLIIDLRSNPGGLLDSVINVADLFFSDGTIVSTRSKIPSENESFFAKPGVYVKENIPIVVLIDKGSASASEILAGALKDRNRAVLIGETTYGKGSVQQVRTVGTGGFRLTTSRYYTPAGTTIDKQGVKPNKEIKEPTLSEKEQDSLNRLTEERTVSRFIESNKAPSESEIREFIEKQKTEGIALSDRILKRLIRNEINRTNNNPPIYDLEFDTVLIEAVRMLRNGEVSR